MHSVPQIEEVSTVLQTCARLEPRRLPRAGTSHAYRVAKELAVIRAARDLAQVAQYQARVIALLESQLAALQSTRPMASEEEFERFMEQAWLEQEEGRQALLADAAEHQFFPGFLAG